MGHKQLAEEEPKREKKVVVVVVSRFNRQQEWTALS